MVQEKTVAAYDPDMIMDSVKARIRSEFVSLIPEDAWKGMVKKAVDGFFATRDGWGAQKVSDFDTLVSRLVQEDTEKRIREFLQGPEWQERWKDGRQVMSEAVERIIKENVGEMVARILGGAIQATLNQTIGQLARP